MDFARREEIANRGGEDPGRTFPQLDYEFEYIPVALPASGSPLQLYMHNPTPYDTQPFAFDNLETSPSPVLHFQASRIALMVQAKPRLTNVPRLSIPKGDVAEAEIVTLLNLYTRNPSKSLPVNPPASIPVNSEPYIAEIEQRTRAHILTSPPDLTPGSPTSINGFSHAEDMGDLYSGADPQLLAYAEERPITLEELQNRPPLQGGVEAGLWRFASADQFVRAP